MTADAHFLPNFILPKLTQPLFSTA